MESVDIAAYLGQLTFWHWLIAGFAFVILEMLIPGAIFLWLGAAAVLSGLLLLLVPTLGWENQLLSFAVLSVICSLLGRMWVNKRFQDSDHPALNRRGEQYVGRRFKLAAPLENGTGRLIIDDTRWRIRGEDLPAGTLVEVTGVDGTDLLVKEASSSAST